MPSTRSAGTTATDAARRLQKIAEKQAAALEKPKPATMGSDAFVSGQRTGANNASVAVDENGVPLRAEDLAKVFPEFASVPAARLPALQAQLKTVTSPTATFSDKAKALAGIAESNPDTVKTTLAKLHITDDRVLSLAGNAKALEAIASLSNPDGGLGDKAAAALKLANAAGTTIGVGEVNEILGGALGKFPAGQKLVEAAVTWADPDKSGLDKAKATVSLAKALKDFAGKDSTGLTNQLRAFDGPFRAVAAGMTLIDGDASIKDKGIALAQLAAEVPELGRDLSMAKKLLVGFGLKSADEIAEAGAAAAEVAVAGLDPALAKNLSADQLGKLKECALKVGDEKLAPVLKGITDPKAAEALIAQLSTLDKEAGTRLLTVVGGMEHGALEASLKAPGTLEKLASLAGKLDADGAATAAKLVQHMEKEGLESFLRFTDNLGPDALKAGVKTLEPLIDHGGGKLVGKGLQMLEGTLGKMGVKLSKEVAEKALKNIAKIIPLAGAIPNVIDAAKYGKQAADLHSKNKDLGFLAVVGAGLNTADAVVGTVLDLTGVGAAVNVPVGMAFAAGELALDIGFDNEKAKYEADPKGYQAPGWVKAVNLAGAAAMGPAGLGSLAAYYGPEAGTQLVQWGVEQGAKGAVELGKMAGVGSAEATGDSLKLAGGMMHAAADVLRHPGEYSKAVAQKAQEGFDAAIAAGGAVGKFAKQTIATVVDDAKKLGAKGLDTLKAIASHPGESAKVALDGITSFVNGGVDLTKAAGKELYKKAVDTLQSVKTGYENLKGAAKEKARELVTAAKEGLSSAVDHAAKLGKDGIELITWAASHPGDVAAFGKKALTDAVAKGGELAQAAWDGIKSMGEKGKTLAESAIKSLANAGAQGVETLKYVINNPGTSATQVKEWAGRTLTDMAKKTGESAKAAATAVKDFIDKRAEWAGKFGRELLSDGSAAFKEVAQAWKTNLTEGGKAFVSGLKDLGDAGVEMLKDVASWAGQLAQEGVSQLKGLAASGSRVAHQAIDGLRTAGSDAAKYAGQAMSSIANYDVKVFGWDITPWN